MKLVLAVLATVLMWCGGAAAAPLSAQDRGHIADIEMKLAPARPPESGPAYATITARMAEYNVPAVSIAFIENGRIKWTRAYGLADVAAARPATPDTLFQAASMSKAVAAAGALRLVEAGKLDLDADVNTRLTGWKVPTGSYTETDKVTLRRLLSHTAGLSVHGFPGYSPGRPVPTPLQILEGKPPANTSAIVSEFRPGEKWSYSGGGYTVAQLMMTEAAAEPFPQLLDRLVLKPAGMSGSTFVQPLPDALRARAATAYDAKGVAIPGRYNTYPEYAAAGLWTTPSDYGRFLIALQDAYDGRSNRLMAAASAKTMATPVLDGYGLGVGIMPFHGRIFINHSGGNEGFRCYFFAFLDGSRQGAVIMTNSDKGDALVGQIVRAIITTYDMDPAKPQP
jgi:CubicO group peptidase (beta-lactamase class C family)